MIDTQQRLILVADDEEDIRRLVVAGAQVRGWEARACETAEELLALVSQLCETGRCPDGVILDVYFKNVGGVALMGGLTAAFEILNKFPHVVVIAFSAVAETFIRHEAAKVGVELVEKPVTMAHLLDKLDGKINLAKKKIEDGIFSTPCSPAQLMGADGSHFSHVPSIIHHAQRIMRGDV